VPSDEERFAELEAELGRLQYRLQGLETRGEYLATREDVEKAKSDVIKTMVGIGVGIDALLIGGIGLAVAILQEAAGEHPATVGVVVEFSR
jgi:hypothetical protein